MSLTLLPLGVGDAFTELHFTSCLALQAGGAGGEQILVDCPHPIRRVLRDGARASGMTIGAETILGVVLTHLHADHASGLEGLAYFSHFALGKRLKVWVHPAVSARLWDGHLAAGMECLMPHAEAAPEPRRLEDFLEIIPLRENAPVQAGGFSIECRRTIHHIPTTALRIRAGGGSIGISADTAFDPSLIAWLAEADLVVHETNFGVHTPYEKLAALPAPLRAKMRLVHYPDSFDLEASTIEPLREGTPVVVRP